MGVTGSGKTTIGERLAAQLEAQFVDGDSLHSDANVAKMEAGTPLDDDDRRPWLARVRDVLRRSDDIVVACSSLKREYRDRLREAGDVRFVYLELDPATAEQRTSSRDDHFMRSEMVASQFDTLERPTADERDVVTVDATADIDTVVHAALTAIGATSSDS